MDFKIQEAVQDLKDRQRNSDSVLDWLEIERSLRQFETELYIKRDEVKQLRTELDKANAEIQNLKQHFHDTKRSLDECQFNLSHQLRKCRLNETELFQKRESFVKIQLEQQMATTEASLLKERLQEMEMEKIDLTKKLETFAAKQRHNLTYDNEITKRNYQLKSFMGKVNETIVKFQVEHAEAVELVKNTRIANHALDKLKVSLDEIEKLRKEKKHFEEMYIKVNAKYQKMEELMAVDFDPSFIDLISKILFNKCKLNRSSYEGEIKEQIKSLNIMTESLDKEKETICKLIKDNELIKTTNEELQKENVHFKELYNDALKNIEELKEKVTKSNNEHFNNSENNIEVKTRSNETQD